MPGWHSSGAAAATILIAGLFLAPSGIFASPSSDGTPEPQQAGGLTAEIYDLYNVPFKEYWDWRGALYGDVPIGADCFSFDSIPSVSAEGYPPSPNPAGTGACDVPPAGYSGETWTTYPYMNWYPWYLDWPGPGTQTGQGVTTIVYAPYRMRMVGVDQPGSTLAQPVILPVFAPDEPAGSSLHVVWDLRYITSPEIAAIDAACVNSNIQGAYDGFVLESTTVVTMDYQESKRTFGVVTTPTAFSPTTNPAPGAWTNPANGFTSDNLYTTSSLNGDAQEYGSYQIPAVTTPIEKVEVGVEGKVAFSGGRDDDVRVEFSTDGGASWTPAGTANLLLSDATIFFNVTSQRAWTATLLSDANFRTRIVHVQVGTAVETVSVDWVPVRVQSRAREFAEAWWASNVDPRCVSRAGVEQAWQAFMAEQGGKSTVTADVGPYDVANSFEWYYQPFATNFESVSFDPVTGTTSVTIKHWAWGTEALLGRWFYWGTTPYFDAGPDGKPGTADDIPNAEIYPHTKAGWWPWEFVWFEDLHFDTTIGATSQDFTFEAVVQYHFVATADPGPDGIYHSWGPDLTQGTADDVVSTDDQPRWLWQPVLADYIYGGTVTSIQGHLWSEMGPYAGPDRTPFTADDLKYLHYYPGSKYYGQNYIYEYTPAEWDLGTGDTVTVRLPTGDKKNVKFLDPYSPLTGNAFDLLLIDGQVGFLESTPALPAGSSATDSDGDGILDTINLVGPIDWGAPALPLQSYPLLELAPVTLPIQVEMSAPWTELAPTQRMDLTVRTTVSGAALPGAVVALSATSGLRLSVTSCVTDAGGGCTTTVTATNLLGPQTVTATASKDPYAAGTGTYVIQVVPAKSMTMVLDPDTTEMMYYETATVRVRLTDTVTTAGLTAGRFTLFSPAGGNLSAVAELGGGEYEFRWDAPKVSVQTFATITVRATVGGYRDASGSVTILVDPNKSFQNAQLFLVVQPEKFTVASGETIGVTVYLFTIEGYVVRGATVTARLILSPGTVSAVTDRLNGVYTFTYTAPVTAEPTTATIRIDAAKLAYGYRSGNVRITLSIQP